MISKFITLLIRKIKGDNTYEFITPLSSRELFSVVFERAFMFLRGLWKQFWLKSCGGSFFVGKNVTIKHGYKLSTGKATTIGSNSTIDALSVSGIEIGDNVTIPENCFIRCTGVISELGVGIKIGNNTGLGHYNFLNGQGGIVIGNDVIIGPYVQILSENHNYKDPNILIRKQGVSRKGIKIGNNVWIGASATILDGVEIGDRCIVAAGAVVTKNILKNSLVVGSPAKAIRAI